MSPAMRLHICAWFDVGSLSVVTVLVDFPVPLWNTQVFSDQDFKGTLTALFSL